MSADDVFLARKQAQKEQDQFRKLARMTKQETLSRFGFASTSGRRSKSSSISKSTRNSDLNSKDSRS